MVRIFLRVCDVPRKRQKQKSTQSNDNDWFYNGWRVSVTLCCVPMDKGVPPSR